jgi:hypothetical protein
MSFPFVWAPASEETNWPLLLLDARDSVECGGPSFNWLRQTQQNPFSNQELVK